MTADPVRPQEALIKEARSPFPKCYDILALHLADALEAELAATKALRAKVKALQVQYTALLSLVDWVPFGFHADHGLCPYRGALTFSKDGEDGLPLFERHADGSQCHPNEDTEALMQDRDFWGGVSGS